MTTSLMAGAFAGLALGGINCSGKRGLTAGVPNIIYLMTDQQKASASSIYGNAQVPSPFMQQIADSGMVFMDAYAVSPICTPSRTAVFTGVHPLVNHVTCHQNRAPYNLPQLSELLSDAGYYTAVAGHYEGDRNLTRGWDDQVRHDDTGVLSRSYDLWKKQGRTDVGWSSGQLPCTVEEGHAYVLTNRVIQMLDGVKAAKAPFFLHVAYLEPHPPYFAPPPFDKLVDPASVQVPDLKPDPGRPEWQAKVQKESGTALATEGDIKKMLAIYYGMIAYADSQMRRLYEALDQRGLLKNTWIIISSDHGDYAGEKGIFAKTESLYECLLHVPLIICPPLDTNAPRGKRVSGLVDLVDLFTTILGIAGAAVPEHAQGRDLITWVTKGARQPLRDYLFSQVGDYKGSLKTTFPTGMPESGRRPGLLQGARNKEFSYVRDPDYGDELYDLRKDPKEVRNLYGRPAPEVSIDQMRRQIDLWEENCVRLRKRLGVIPGYRGFT